MSSLNRVSSYLLRNRVNTTNPIYRDVGWAFDHFNFEYGIKKQEKQEDNNVVSDIASVKNNDTSDESSGKSEDSDTSDGSSGKNEDSNTSEEDTDKTEESSLSGEETDKTKDSKTTNDNSRLPENIAVEKKIDSIKIADKLTDTTTVNSDSNEHPNTTNISKSTESDEIGKLPPSVQSWINSAVGRDWADIDEEDHEEGLISGSYTVSIVDEACTTQQSTTTPHDQEDTPSFQSWINSAVGRDWADIDEEDQEEDLISRSYAVSIVDEACITQPSTPALNDQEDIISGPYTTSSMDEVCITRPNSPTNFDDHKDELFVDLPPYTYSPSFVTFAPTSEELDDEEIEECNPETENCVQVTENFETFERDFWNFMYSAPLGQANPDGQLYYQNYQEPPGDYHALSFACYPQTFKSLTSAATSLWAVTSSGVSHRLHGSAKPFSTKQLGVPFSRQSILTAQACKTVNPIRFDGPGHLLENHTGSKLQDAVIGYAHNTFLPVGQHVDEPLDPENPHTLHLPMDSHWSILTVPRTTLTPPYFFDHRDSDHHLPPGLPGGTGKSKKRAAPKKPSPLRYVKMCYESEEELAGTVANKPIETATNTITPLSPEPSYHPEEDHGSPELLSWYTPIEQDTFEMDDDTMEQHENQQIKLSTSPISHQAKAKEAEAVDADVSLTSELLLQKIKADLRAELKQELATELREELKQEIKAEMKAELQLLDAASSPNSTTKSEITISTNTTRSPSASSFFSGESVVGAVTWTAAGSALLAIGVVTAVVRGLRR